MLLRKWLSKSLPETYKAVVCVKANEPWQVVDKPMRAPGPEEVLVRVHASDGIWPGIAYPRIPGHEVIGRVADVRNDCSASKREQRSVSRWDHSLPSDGMGDTAIDVRIAALETFGRAKNLNYTGFTIDGGYAEYMYAPETAVVHLDEDMLQRNSYAELAPLFCAGATVFDAIRTSKWNVGDRCLVQGIGGLGHLAVQYAAKMGLVVYAASSGSSKRDLALKLGATEYIDSSTTNVVEYMQSLGGAKLIICTAPKAELISAILPAVAINGTITLVSAATDGQIQVSNLLLNMNRATLRGFCCGCSPDMEKCVKFSTQSNVKAMVQEFPIEQF
ncbi:hypothetical protein BDP27DRAFT_1451905 [Rhodocollybia butyracea]|uniref:Uncharacterized protein n=1 Tax=Rhodocollybia butyracea TaxID=206335 RepID=A0A9P5U209_9AGAR|nr:hypothetical protein BDP27DRAFT_1451905 [Rhodocollybia butyracea]